MNKLQEIQNNSELEVGAYYHCFDKTNGKHSIQRCYKHSEDSYLCIGEGAIWADDRNNQALEKWRMFKVLIPTLNTIGLCKEHHGHGFKSDCAICTNYTHND